jgi:hypothetical protein
MKSAPFFLTAAAVLCWMTVLQAQVAPKNVPDAALPLDNAVVPAPATPAVPTPGGERRAIQREQRRIDRNDPSGNQAPAVQPNGKVTVSPYATDATPNMQFPASPDQWRYRNQNGQWWYYTPSNAWMIWDGNRWVANTPNAGNVAPPVPSNGAYTTYYRAPNQTYYGRPYRRGLFGRRY